MPYNFGIMKQRTRTAAGGTCKRILVILLAALLLAVSVFCVIEIHDHDCTGENCPVCAMVQHFEHTAKSVIAAGVVAAFGAAVLWLALALVGITVRSALFATPVLLGVRSNS